jgi:hypothetical protein
MMGKYLMVVPSGAQEGRDQDYNDWYDNTHLGQICSIPGITSGRRWDAIPQTPNPQPSPYLAIYEIETEDPSAVIAELVRRSEAGEIDFSDSLDLNAAKVWMYKAH